MTEMNLYQILKLASLNVKLCDFFSLRVAETLLPGTEFHRYKRGDKTVMRSSSQYSVHEDVSDHLDFGKPRLTILV